MTDEMQERLIRGVLAQEPHGVKVDVSDAERALVRIIDAERAASANTAQLYRRELARADAERAAREALTVERDAARAESQYQRAQWTKAHNEVRAERAAREAASERVEALEAKCALLSASLKQETAAREAAERWVRDLQSGMYVNCVYCGHRYGPGETTPVSMADALKAHVEACPKHPMSALRAERDRLVQGMREIIAEYGPRSDAGKRAQRYLDSLTPPEGES